MTKRWLVPILLLTAAVTSGKASGPEPHSPKTEHRPVVTPVTTPLFFEENHGQTDARVKFLSRGGGYTLALTSDEALIAVGAKDPALLRMRLEGATPKTVLSGVDPLPGKIYYADVAKQGPLTPNEMFARVKYADAYPGIDLVYYGNNRELEFDFVVAPYADPTQIRFSLTGADKLSIDRNGELTMRARAREIRLKRPVIYQERDGVRRTVSGGYALSGKNNRIVTFALDRYDRSLPLVIDPTWIFGSTTEDTLVGLEVDSNGQPHVLSTTINTNGMFFTDEKPGFAAPPLCVLSKLDVASGSFSYVIVFRNMDSCEAFALSPNDVSYFAGVNLGNPAVATIASVNESTGAPVVNYFTVGNYDLRFSEDRLAMAVNSLEELYLLAACRVVGAGDPPLELSGYNETPDPQQGTLAEACKPPQLGFTGVRQPLLTKVDASGNVLYATFLAPGMQETRPYGLAVDNAGRAFIVGHNATTLPVTVGGADPECATRLCAYLLELDTTTIGPASLLYAEHLWRVDNVERALVRLGPTGELYVAFEGVVTSNFPNNRPTNPYPWEFIRFPDTTEGLQLARFDLDANGVPGGLNWAFIFNAWTAGPALGRDRLKDLRVLPSGAPVIASTRTEVGAPDPIVRGSVTTFYRSGERLANRAEYLVDTSTSSSDPFLVAADAAGTVYAAFQRLRSGTGPDLDIWVDQVGPRDPGVNTPPAFSANDVTVVAPAFSSGAFVNGFSYFYYDAEDGLTPGSGGCDRQLGSFFQLGSTLVTCTFTDSGALSVTGTFNVIVNEPPYEGAPFVGLQATPPDDTSNSNYNAGLFSWAPVRIAATTAESDARAFLRTRLDQQPPIPSHLQAGSPPIYFELDTTRTQGPYTVCIDTTGMSFPKPSTIRMYHFARPPIADWLDVTLNNSSNAGEVCGTSVTLGTFAIFYPQIPETAITTIAGNGTRAYSIDGPGGDPADDFVAGPATSTPLGYLFGGAYDRTRNTLYFSDGSFIMRLNLNTNVVSQVAGNGIIQIGMIDGPGGDPRDDYVDAGHPFNTYVGLPWEMTVDAAGDLVFFDRNSCRLRRLDLAQNRLFSVAGNGICGNSGDGFNALSASIAVSNLAYDGAGNLFFADASNMVVRRIDHATNTITTVAGDGTTGIPVDGSPLATLTPAQALAFDRQGHLVVGAGMDIVRISPGADGLVNGSADETMTVLTGCHTNCVAPFYGDGLPITDPKVFIGNVRYLMVADDGAIIVSDNNRVRRIAPGADGVVTKISDEIIQTIAGYYDALNLNENYNGDTFATQSRISTYVTIAEDAQGRLLIVDTNNFRVRRFGIVATGSSNSADIQVSAQDTPDPIQTGARLDYTIRVENSGPADATGVALSYTLPSGAEFHGVSGSPLPSCVTPSVGGTGTVTCDLGSLASGASRDLTISVTPRSGGTLPAQFTVTTTAPDANPGNNTWSLTTTVELAPAVITINETIFVSDAPAVLPSAMLTITETIHVEDGPQVLPSAMLTINETIAVTDAPTVSPVDSAPPILDLPGNMTRGATGPTGGAVSYAAQAYDLIDGPVAVLCTPPPDSFFPLGTTTVTCTASDAAGNSSTGTFTVTVIIGTPNITVRIYNKGRDATGYFVDLEWRNTGDGNSPLYSLSTLGFRTLTGTGTVTYSPQSLGPLPIEIPNFTAGALAVGHLRLQVPATVRRFSITFQGTYTNVLGAVSSFSITQTVIP